MNLYNEDYLQTFCRNLAARFVMPDSIAIWLSSRIAQQLRATDDNPMIAIGQQLSNLNVHVKVIVTTREAVIHSFRSVPHHIIDWNDMPLWLRKRTLRGQPVYEVSISDEGRIHNLMEAVVEKYGVRDSYSVTLTDAIQISQERQARLERQASLREGQIEEVMTALDAAAGKNYVIVRLLDKQAVKREGLVMHHCVGNYTPTETERFYSLREVQEDGTHVSRATIQTRVYKHAVGEGLPTTKESVVQARGVTNAQPSAEHNAILEGWYAQKSIELQLTLGANMAGGVDRAIAHAMDYGTILGLDPAGRIGGITRADIMPAMMAENNLTVERIRQMIQEACLDVPPRQLVQVMGPPDDNHRVPVLPLDVSMAYRNHIPNPSRLFRADLLGLENRVTATILKPRPERPPGDPRFTITDFKDMIVKTDDT